MKMGSGIQKINRVGQTHGQDGATIRVLLFLRIRKVGQYAMKTCGVEV
jgi:hypothetical protein